MRTSNPSFPAQRAAGPVRGGRGRRAKITSEQRAEPRVPVIASWCAHRRGNPYLPQEADSRVASLLVMTGRESKRLRHAPVTGRTLSGRMFDSARRVVPQRSLRLCLLHGTKAFFVFRKGFPPEGGSWHGEAVTDEGTSGGTCSPSSASFHSAPSPLRGEGRARAGRVVMRPCHPSPHRLRRGGLWPPAGARSAPLRPTSRHPRRCGACPRPPSRKELAL